MPRIEKSDNPSDFSLWGQRCGSEVKNERWLRGDVEASISSCRVGLCCLLDLRGKGHSNMQFFHKSREPEHSTASIFGSDARIRGVLGFWLRGKLPLRIQSEATDGARKCLGLIPWVPFSLGGSSEDSSEVCHRRNYAGSAAKLVSSGFVENCCRTWSSTRALQSLKRDNLLV